MSKIRVNEIFGPAGYWNFSESAGEFDNTFVERWGVTQGEGKFVGQRSVFLRTFGCNFECRGFGLPKGQSTTEPEEFAKSVGLYKSINDVPAAKFGCDSYYSWHSDFKHLSPFLDVDHVAEMLLKAAGGSFFNGTNPIHLIITGGEPMLGWQREYPRLVARIRELDPVWKPAPWKKLSVTIETNGTKDLVKGKTESQPYMFMLRDMCNITWSVSAKLSISGHSNEEAIKPSVIRQYYNVSDDIYLKFVVQSIDDFVEVDSVVAKYKTENLSVPVYIMPEGGTPDEFSKHSTIDIISEAVKRGYNITPRLHVMWGGNTVGW
jgi:organic radical activating enzyme